MKLEKAREIIKLNIKEAGKSMPPDTLTALIMHAGAVEVIEKERRDSVSYAGELLPGETEE